MQPDIEYTKDVSLSFPFWRLIFFSSYFPRLCSMNLTVSVQNSFTPRRIKSGVLLTVCL